MLHQKSKYSPLLSYWNPDKYPYYIVSIKDILRGNDAEMYLKEKRNDNDEIIFVNNGNATIKHFYRRRSEIKTVSAVKNDVVFSPGGTYCELYDASADFEFTVIRFSLYTCDALSSQSHALNLSDIISEDITHTRVYIDIPLHTRLSDNKKFLELVSEVVNEFKSKTTGYQMQIQTALIQMLLILLRNNSLEFDSILCNVNVVGISSKYSSNTAMPPNCSLTVSDIEILPKKPEPSKKRPALSVYKTSKMALLPEFYDSIRCDYEAGDTPPPVITISTESESGYHVWLYPDAQKFTPDLRPYKKNAYIRFFAKSTVAMSFGVVVYNHDIHRCIIHTFYIEPSDKFTEFCVPLLQGNEERTMTPYIYDILDYIDKNYQSKIKLEDIAESVHLNSSYLSKVFKDQMGISISDHILNRRLNAAVLLLKKHPEKPVSDIAMETGFYDTAHFSKAFKAAYSMTALQYKKHIGKPSGKADE